MSNIEIFAEVIASKVSTKLSLNDKDKEEVLAYGAFVLIQTMISIIMVAIFGIFFNVLFEALIISFTTSFLRKSSGGAHATTPMNCALISVFVFGGLALLVKHYIIYKGVIYIGIGVIIAFVFTYYIMFRYSPVETATKPLRNENTRKRLKRNSIKIVLSLFILSILLMILYLQTGQLNLCTAAICIAVGVMWQSITMVSLGHKIINGLDRILRATNSLQRRRSR